MFNLDSLKLVLSRTNFSKIFEPALKNLFPLLASHTKANQCMSVVVKALSKVESTHARKRCCFLLLAIGLLQWRKKMQSIATKWWIAETMKTRYFTTYSIHTFFLHYPNFCLLTLCGVHSGIKWMTDFHEYTQWPHAQLEICIYCKICTIYAET